jgi:exopolysaccharide production protein ExoZ
MKLPNIQILRACAALMIVIYHCGIETGRLSGAAGGGKLFDEVPWGSGVPLFFAISGFIMVVTSASAFGSWSAAVDFMRRRIIRIVPLYWLVTTFALVGILVMPSLSKAPPGGPAGRSILKFCSMSSSPLRCFFAAASVCPCCSLRWGYWSRRA